jgi:sec-independent protein translocase protein TatA
MKSYKLFWMIGYLLTTLIIFTGCVGRIGGWEVIIILALIILLFGAKKLPELARSLGSGLREFRKATKEFEAGKDIDDDDSPSSKTKPSITQSTSESEKDQT